MLIQTLASYQTATQFEEGAKNAANEKEKLFCYLQGAILLSPKQGELPNEQEKKEFLKCALLWKQAAELLIHSGQSLGDLSNYCFQIDTDGLNYFACASKCYFNAAKALNAGSINKKEINDEMIKVLKKADWALQGAHTPQNSLRIKERELEILHWKFNYLKLNKLKIDSHLKLEKKISNKEMKIYEKYTELDEQNTETDWRIHMKRAHHLMQAAITHSNLQQKEALLLQAEEIARGIWYHCPSPTNYPEFSPNYASNPEYTLLGKIQMLLGHCYVTPLFTTPLVAIDL